MSDNEDSPPLPPEIQVEELLPEGVRYVFPRHPQKVNQIGGWVLVAVGFGCLAALVIKIVDLAQAPDLFAIFSLAPTLLGSGLILVGLYCVAAWSEISLQGGDAT